MAIGTYAELQTAGANWLSRSGESETTSRMPEFIALFESRVLRKLRVRQMEVRSTATLDGQYIALPGGMDSFLEMRQLKLNTDPATVLTPVSPDYLFSAYGSSAAGLPRVFSVVGSEIGFGPIPDSAYAAEMWFYQFDALSDTNTTNWLLTAHPDIYLFGALVEAEAYLVNDPRVPLWEQRLTKALQELDASDWRARWSGGSLQMRSDTGNP